MVQTVGGGGRRALRRGETVNVGDTIQTGADGTVLLEFVDAGVIEVLENTGYSFQETDTLILDLAGRTTKGARKAYPGWRPARYVSSSAFSCGLQRGYWNIRPRARTPTRAYSGYNTGYRGISSGGVRGTTFDFSTPDETAPVGCAVVLEDGRRLKFRCDILDGDGWIAYNGREQTVPPGQRGDVYTAGPPVFSALPPEVAAALRAFKEEAERVASDPSYVPDRYRDRQATEAVLTSLAPVLTDLFEAYEREDLSAFTRHFSAGFRGEGITGGRFGGRSGSADLPLVEDYARDDFDHLDRIGFNVEVQSIRPYDDGSVRAEVTWSVRGAVRDTGSEYSRTGQRSAVTFRWDDPGGWEVAGWQGHTIFGLWTEDDMSLAWGETSSAFPSTAEPSSLSSGGPGSSTPMSCDIVVDGGTHEWAQSETMVIDNQSVCIRNATIRAPNCVIIRGGTVRIENLRFEGRCVLDIRDAEVDIDGLDGSYILVNCRGTVRRSRSPVYSSGGVRFE